MPFGLPETTPYHEANINEAPISFEQFYKEKYNGNVNPYGLFGRIGNFFSGHVSSAEQAYQNYLADYEYKKNEVANSAANKMTFAREDSQIQRLIEDYKSAGLNPYMLLTGGNLSSGVVSSQAQKPDYKRASKVTKEKSKSGSIVSTAIRAIAMVAMLGA